MQENTKKFVIGGGISGLIYAFYNPEFIIISPDVGGQMTHGMYSMTWIHDTPETRQLLNDLKIPFKETTTLMGYYYNKKINENCDDISNIKIIKKKMSDWTNFDNNFEIKDKTLSVPETYIKTLETDFSEVIKRISKKVNIINDYIIKIDKDKIYGQNGEYNYSSLVSTMPARIFWNNYQGEKNIPDLKSTPITFIVSKHKFDWYDNKYEMVYIAEDYYFTRVSYRNSGEYVYEFTGIMPEDIWKKIYSPDVIKYYINKFGRIHSIENKPPQDNIIFLGRFAEWKHSSKIQNVIYKSLYKKI
jgi:hypothetical protein